MNILSLLKQAYKTNINLKKTKIMIRTYKYAYDFGSAYATLEIDTDVLSKDDATQLLNFFAWDWDNENDVYDELAKKYALSAIKFATHNSHNLIGVLSDFKEAEGYPELNGVYGIKLIYVEGLEIEESELELLER